MERAAKGGVANIWSTRHPMLRSRHLLLDNPKRRTPLRRGDVAKKIYKAPGFHFFKEFSYVLVEADMFFLGFGMVTSISVGATFMSPTHKTKSSAV